MVEVPVLLRRDNHLRLYNLDKAELTNCVFNENYSIDVKGINGSKNVDIVFNNCSVAPTTRSASTKKLVELLDLSVLSKYTAATYVIDGTRLNNKAVMIRTVDELLTAAETAYAGNTHVVLLADLDLTGVAFNGFKIQHGVGANCTIDGMGYTVSNFVREEDGASDFGFVSSWIGTIKNITLKDCRVKGYGRLAILAGNVYCDIINCHVIGGSAEASYWSCGAIAAHFNSGSVRNCSVDGVTVKTNGAAGGIVGLLNESTGTRGFYNCSIKNSTVNNTGSYGESYCGGLVCGMINISNSTIEFEGCTIENCTKEGSYVGDLYYDSVGNVDSNNIVVK